MTGAQKFYSMYSVKQMHRLHKITVKMNISTKVNINRNIPIYRKYFVSIHPSIPVIECVFIKYTFISRSLLKQYYRDEKPLL